MSEARAARNGRVSCGDAPHDRRVRAQACDATRLARPVQLVEVGAAAALSGELLKVGLVGNAA